MKTLIISDLHLTDRFDPDKAEYLLELLGEADRVVLNGDFWDNHATSFDRFMNSNWKILFPVLKSRQTIYIFGNHDPETDCDERVGTFSDFQANHWRLRDGALSLHIEHGHHILAKHRNSPRWMVTLFRVSLYDIWFRTPLERYLITTGHDFLHRWHMGANQQELLHKASTFDDDLLITGHTHLPYSNPGSRYVNLGYINHGVSYYVLVEKGQAFYVQEQYLPHRQLVNKTNLLNSKKPLPNRQER